jgi:putative ABC transport system permease protein
MEKSSSRISPLVAGQKTQEKMLKNYLRSLRKEPVFSAINIFGLALGLAVCLLIALFVSTELQYDGYHKNADRIFRVVSDIHINGNGINSVATPGPMGPALVKDYPQIEAAVHIRRIIGGVLVRKGADSWLESNAVLADPSLFQVFTLPLVEGNPQTALSTPNSLLISASLSKKYFNSIHSLGRVLQFDDDTTSYAITGVMNDMPAHSHFHLGLVRSLTGRSFNNSNAWINLYSTTYLLARPGVNTAEIDHMLAEEVAKYVEPQVRKELHDAPGDMAKKGNYFRYYSMPLRQIHLHSNVMGEFEPNGNIRYIYVLIILAVLILLLACVNFVNLSTACSARRSKEIGVRKVLGSSRQKLIIQFLQEAMLTSAMALILAVGLAVLLLPWFSQLSGRSFIISNLLGGWAIPSLLLATLIVGLLSGGYPAFFLSSFQPVKVLKGQLTTGFKRSRLRNALVGFQFAAAIVLVGLTLGIYRQLQYIRTRDIGYNREQVLTIWQTKYLGQRAETFKQMVLSLPGVISGTMTGYLPNTLQMGTRGFFTDAAARANESQLMGDWRIDADYIPTLGMQIVMGRNFSPLMKTDSSSVLINETAVRLLGHPNPIGEIIYTGPDPVTPFHIVGVVKDFNTSSLHKKIEPIVFSLGSNSNAFAFRIRTADVAGLIASIGKYYHALSNASPFDYSFLDDDFAKLYATDQRMGSLFVSLTLLSLVIAFLGLFGLVNYAAEQRAREVVIRRVLGADIRHVILLFSREIAGLLIISALIACPLAWWGLYKWLEDFAYRAPISIWAFIIAACGIATLALLTVGIQAVRAAIVNPAKRLRTE